MIIPHVIMMDWWEKMWRENNLHNFRTVNTTLQFIRIAVCPHISVRVYEGGIESVGTFTVSV